MSGVIQAGEQRKLSVPGGCGDHFFRVFPKTKKMGIIMKMIGSIGGDIFLFDPQHNMQQRPVDTGLRELPCFQKFAELLVVKIMIELRADPVGKFLRNIHVSDQGIRFFVEQFIL